MLELSLKKDYKRNDELRLSFSKLSTDTFGIDFEPWYQAGFWNDRYKNYSYIDGDTVVANVSVNRMDIIWQGEEKKAIQIGTVMTHPDYRRKGLAYKLMQEAIKDNEKEVDFMYLFGGDDALGLYSKCGFEPMYEDCFKANIEKLNSTETKMRKLDISKEEDLDIIKRLSNNRKYVSSKLGVTNDEHLIFFYTLLVYTDETYYLEEEDTIVIFDIEEDTLNLYEVISQREIDVEKIISKIKTGETKQVAFMFTPEVKELELEVEKLEQDDCTLMVKDLDINVDKEFMFPAISHA